MTKKRWILPQFIGNQTIKMEMKAREERESLKKTSVAFKASSRENKKKGVVVPTILEDEEEMNDEDFSKLVKMMKEIFYKRERRRNPRMIVRKESNKSHNLRLE